MSIFKHDAYETGGYDKEELLFIARCMEARIKELEKRLSETQDYWIAKYYPASFAETLASHSIIDNPEIALIVLSKFKELYKDRDHWRFEVDQIDMVNGAISLLNGAISESEFNKLIDMKNKLEKE